MLVYVFRFTDTRTECHTSESQTHSGKRKLCTTKRDSARKKFVATGLKVVDFFPARSHVDRYGIIFDKISGIARIFSRITFRMLGLK